MKICEILPEATYTDAGTGLLLLNGYINYSKRIIIDKVLTLPNFFR